MKKSGRSYSRWLFRGTLNHLWIGRCLELLRCLRHNAACSYWSTMSCASCERLLEDKVRTSAWQWTWIRSGPFGSYSFLKISRELRPGQSLHLNPTDTLWVIWNRHKRQKSPQNIIELKEFCMGANQRLVEYSICKYWVYISRNVQICQKSKKVFYWMC